MHHAISVFWQTRTIGTRTNSINLAGYLPRRITRYPRGGDTTIYTTGCEYAHDRACYRSAARVRSTLRRFNTILPSILFFHSAFRTDYALLQPRETGLSIFFLSRFFMRLQLWSRRLILVCCVVKWKNILRWWEQDPRKYIGYEQTQTSVKIAACREAFREHSVDANDFHPLLFLSL